MTEVLNYTEFAALARCERQWAYSFVLNEEEVGERAGLHLGTLCHKWHESWMQGNGAVLPREWSDDISAGGKPGETRSYSLNDFDPDLVARAEWLARRWESHYGSQPPSHWNVISTEGWLEADTSWGRLVGRTDGVIEIDGDLWLNEVKSYGTKGRMDYIGVDPQVGVYATLVEAMYGRPLFGIIYDGIYTYRWKPKVPTLKVLAEEIKAAAPQWWNSAGKIRRDEACKEAQSAHHGIEREPHESFQREYLDLSADHLRTTAAYLTAAVHRRADLVDAAGLVIALDRPAALLARTIPNVGRDCSWCGHKPRCWSELGGVEPSDPEFEIDEGDPV